MRLAHVAAQRFKVEIQLAQVLGLEPIHLELDGHEAVQTPMEEQEVEREVAATHLQRELRTDEAEVAPQLDEEGAKLTEQAAVQVGLCMARLQVEELARVGILESGPSCGAMQMCRHCRHICRAQNSTLEGAKAVLPF